MIVEQLILELQKLPQDWKVLIPDYGTYLECNSVFVEDEGQVALDIE